MRVSFNDSVSDVVMVINTLTALSIFLITTKLYDLFDQLVISFREALTSLTGQKCLCFV